MREEGEELGQSSGEEEMALVMKRTAGSVRNRTMVAEDDLGQNEDRDYSDDNK